MDNFELQDHNGITTFVVTGPWTKHSELALLESGAEGLCLNYALGYQERSLDFLEAWPIKRLQLLSRTTQDLAPIYRMSGTIEGLILEDGSRESLDYRRFPRLRLLAADLAPDGIDYLRESLNLEKLIIHGYHGEDLWPMASLSSLTSLEIVASRTLRSLSGVQLFPALTELSVPMNRSLRDIGDLREAPASLNELDFQFDKAISDLDPLKNVTNLAHLNIQEMGPIESITPLRCLAGLVRIEGGGSTRIADNDLSPLFELPHLKRIGLMERRSYRPSVAEVRTFHGLVK